MPGYRELFEKYPNPVFIETGTYLGDGIRYALQAGFEKVYSIEILDYYYRRSLILFGNDKRVKLFKGDSGSVMTDLLKLIDTPATFWLDAHYSGTDTGMGEVESPLLQELDAIGKHHIKTHTIIIDDLRDWKFEKHGFDTNSLIERLLEINNNYRICFENGIDSHFNIFIKDILVAICQQ